MKEKKISLEELIEKVDAAKKTNPLDLSSDQDLSIALMNLISLEEHFFFSGSKTGKVGFYDMINIVRDMRKDLMTRIVKKSTEENGEVWCISKHLLAASMRLMEVGTKALGAGDKKDAYNLFAKAHELYCLFWGINMDMVDLSQVQKDETLDSNLRKWVGEKISDKRIESCPLNLESKKSNEKKHGVLGGLGDWVKRSVNCCIE